MRERERKATPQISRLSIFFIEYRLYPQYIDNRIYIFDVLHLAHYRRDKTLEYSYVRTVIEISVVDGCLETIHLHGNTSRYCMYRS